MDLLGQEKSEFATQEVEAYLLYTRNGTLSGADKQDKPLWMQGRIETNTHIGILLNLDSTSLEPVIPNILPLKKTHLTNRSWWFVLDKRTEKASLLPSPYLWPILSQQQIIGGMKIDEKAFLGITNRGQLIELRSVNGFVSTRQSPAYPSLLESKDGHKELLAFQNPNSILSVLDNKISLSKLPRTLQQEQKRNIENPLSLPHISSEILVPYAFGEGVSISGGSLNPDTGHMRVHIGLSEGVQCGIDKATLKKVNKGIDLVVDTLNPDSPEQFKSRYRKRIFDRYFCALTLNDKPVVIYPDPSNHFSLVASVCKTNAAAGEKYRFDAIKNVVDFVAIFDKKADFERIFTSELHGDQLVFKQYEISPNFKAKDLGNWRNKVKLKVDMQNLKALADQKDFLHFTPVKTDDGWKMLTFKHGTTKGRKAFTDGKATDIVLPLFQLVTLENEK